MALPYRSRSTSGDRIRFAPLLGAARARAVAGHAFGRIDLLPAFRRRVVHPVPIRRADVRPRSPAGRRPARRPRAR